MAIDLSAYLTDDEFTAETTQPLDLGEFEEFSDATEAATPLDLGEFEEFADAPEPEPPPAPPLDLGEFAEFEDTPKPEESWRTALTKTLENVPTSLHRSALSVAEDLRSRIVHSESKYNREASNLMLASKTDPEKAAELRALGFDTTTFDVSDMFNFTEVQNDVSKALRLQGYKDDPELQDTVAKVRELTKILQENAPDVEPWTLKWAATSMLGGFAEMAPSVILAAVTRRPQFGATEMYGQAYGSALAEGQERGLDTDTNRQRAMVVAGAEAISERIPLGVLVEAGGSALKRSLKAAGAEGLQEPFSQAIQMGYDVNVLNDEMTWGEALDQLAQASVIGAGVGGGFGLVVRPDVGPELTQVEAQLQEAATADDALGGVAARILNDSQRMGRETKGRDALAAMLSTAKVEPATQAEEFAGFEALAAAAPKTEFEVPAAPAVEAPPTAAPAPPELDAVEASPEVIAARKAAEKPVAEVTAPVEPPAAAPTAEVTKPAAAPTAEVTKPAPTTDKQIRATIDEAVKAVESAPTEAQIEAGNYPKAHVSVQGMPITIENPKGSTRSGTDTQGEAWSQKMQDDYGYIKGTVGADKDHVDVFIGDKPSSDAVFVVDQIVPETGKFDEHKVIIGATTEAEATEIYARNYAKDWKGLGSITEMPVAEFKTWVNDPKNTKRPMAEGIVVAPAKGVTAVVEAAPPSKPLRVADVAEDITVVTPPTPPAPPTPPTGKGLGKRGFKAPTPTRMDKLVQKVQNKFLPVLLTQEEIKKATGKAVPEEQDVSLAEESFYGKTKNDIERLETTHIQPLAKGMAESNISREVLDEWLIANHAKERNAQIAKINPKMPDGGSGMTNAEAEMVFASADAAGITSQLEELSQYIYDMQDEKQRLKKSGLQDDEVTGAENAVYKKYVPLKGFAEDETSDGTMRVGKGFKIAGKESMRAMGRRSQAESPVLHTIKDVTETIIRSRKNEVGNVLLDLVDANPNPEYWEVFVNESPDVERKLLKNKAGETVMEGKVSTASMRKDYFVTKRDGKEYFIKLKDDQLMRAMTDMGPEALGPVLRTMNTVTRTLSALSTTYNPEFMISNMSRDIQTAVINMLAEQDLPQGRASGKKIAAKMVKGVPSAMRAIHASLRGKTLKGKGAEWQTVYEQFKEDGAETGWFDMKEVDELAGDLESMISVAQGGAKGNARKAAIAVKDFVNHANVAVENAVRLSAYRNAIEAGISRKKSASLAKNLTVNFNRKGEIGQAMNAAYMFFNASVQGSATFARAIGTFKKDPETGKRALNAAQKLAAGIVGSSVLLAMMNREMAGDDDDGENFYDKVPAYVRERNIVIMKSVFGGPEGEYYTFPLPYGYNMFYVLGDTIEASVNSEFRSDAELATHLTMSVLGSFFPLGLETSKEPSKLALKTAAPTVFKPFVQLAVNESFFGTPIYKDNYPFGTKRPDSALTRKSTKEHWIAISQFMNEATGGSAYREGWMDISPDSLNHLFRFGTGGAGDFASRTANFIEKKAKGEDIPVNEIPFVRKVQGEIKPYEDIGRFYERSNEIKQIADEHDSLTGKDKVIFRRKYTAELSLAATVKATEKRLRALRKEARADQEAADAVQIKIDVAVDEFNKTYNEKVR